MTAASCQDAHKLKVDTYNDRQTVLPPGGPCTIILLLLLGHDMNGDSIYKSNVLRSSAEKTGKADEIDG